MQRAVLILAATLVAGCPKSGTTAGPATPPLSDSSVLSQQEMAKRFAAEPTVYRGCVAVSDDELMAGGHESTYAVSEQAIEVTWKNGDTRTFFPDERGNVFRMPPDDADTYQFAVVLLDDLIYLLANYTDSGFDVNGICHRNHSEATIRSIPGREHSARVRTYHVRRGWLAAEEAEANKDVLTPEDEERLALARTMVSITLKAYSNGPAYLTAWNVTATLPDGTTMFLRGDDPIFDDLFETSEDGGDIGSYVQVWLKDDESIRADQEVFYGREGSWDFECRGATGAAGSDMDYDRGGGLNYDGRRGEDGADVTVRITTTGRSNDSGEQILRYRLTCGEQTKQFDASASSPVSVRTYGGAGGHAIPKSEGAGSDGGRGGDGGHIVLIVDPSVDSYNVSTSTQGGPGGKASDPEITNDSEEGTPGQRGEDGTISKRRETVVIPD